MPAVVHEVVPQLREASEGRALPEVQEDPCPSRVVMSERHGMAGREKALLLLVVHSVRRHEGRDELMLELGS